MTGLEVDLLKPGATLKDRYEVVRRIKIGGMGAVYQVRDRTFGKLRALKVMLPGLVTPAMLERFRQEASIPGKVESDNVVDVLDMGVDEGSGLPFLVMELLKGEDLAARLERGPLSPAETLLHLHRASLALDRAHAADIVHRDLKPENLFVTMHADGTEGLKVLDFGIAKIVAESARSKTTLNLGTPPYMSPEQILGKGDIGPGSDIYSLAHVAFTLLTGHAYWEPEIESMASTPFLTRVAEGATEPASVRAARTGCELTSGFDAWFQRATAVSPADRFDSASELVAELGDALGLPVPQGRLPLPPGPGAGSEDSRTVASPRRPVARPDVSEATTELSKTNSTSAVSSSTRRQREGRRLTGWFLTGIFAALLVSAAAYGWLRLSRPGSPEPLLTRVQASARSPEQALPVVSSRPPSVASSPPAPSQSTPAPPKSGSHRRAPAPQPAPDRAYDPMEQL